MTTKSAKTPPRLNRLTANGRPTSREVKLNRLHALLANARIEALDLNELVLAYFIDMAVEELKLLHKSYCDLPDKLTDRLVL